MSTLIKVAIFGDTHIRPENDESQFAFESDKLHTRQARETVASIINEKPDLVIHMGDVVHPIPALDSHIDALNVAKKIFDKLECPLYVVPGNHDIGDKKNTSNAPAIDIKNKITFEKYWNAPYLSFDKNGVHFIILDSISICYDDENAARQKDWLLKDLENNKNKRNILFMHFPVFLYKEEEEEHYDNLPKGIRNFLLDQIKTHEIECCFSGHVHRFFYNRVKNCELYTMPSTSFVRPEYANLRTVKPSDPENGRDDKEQLGYCILDIKESGHQFEIRRNFSRSDSNFRIKKNIGVWLHKRLRSAYEIPYSDLDILKRKYARNDATLIHLLNLGISYIRIPLEDMKYKAVEDAVFWLKRQGLSCHYYCGGFPDEKQANLFGKLSKTDSSSTLEIILKESDYNTNINFASSYTLSKYYFSKIGKKISKKDTYHSHFPRIGFDPMDPLVKKLNKNDKLKNFTFRLYADKTCEEQLEEVLLLQKQYGIKAICHIEIPYLSEAKMQLDEKLVERKCLEAASLSKQYPEILFFLDQFYDKDRGYWCRNGLISNADVPRKAYDELKKLSF